MPRALPRGPHRLAREVVLASQRGRLLDAMAETVAAKGYGATTVADVIDRAGVSRKTFYEHFRDREDCFLAAFDTGVEVLLATVRGAGSDVADPLERTRARIRAYLETLAAEPAFARTFIVEAGAAGPRALERRHAAVREFADLTRETAAEAGLPDIPADVALAAVGATNEVVAQHLHDGRAAELPALEDLVVRVTLSVLTAAG